MHSLHITEIHLSQFGVDPYLLIWKSKGDVKSIHGSGQIGGMDFCKGIDMLIESSE